MRSISKKVSPLGWVIMEEKLNERDIPSIDAEKYIENRNNVRFQGGYSIPWAASSKTIFKMRLGFVNISIERDNIMIKHVF